MSKICIVILILIQITILSAQIEEISFSSGRAVFEYGEYKRGVYRYDDRLIVQSSAKIEEFDILQNGQLERIFFFENGENYFGVVDGNKFYSFGFWQSSQYWHITVFDLSVKPMRFLSKFSTDIDRLISSVLFSENHIIITDYDKVRATLFNKETFNIEGYINGFYGYRIFKSDNIIAQPLQRYDQTGLVDFFIRFYLLDEEDGYEFSYLSDISIFDRLRSVTHMDFNDNKLFISGHTGVLIVDISDIITPNITHFISTTNYPRHTLYDNEQLYVIDYLGNLCVFTIKEFGDYDVDYNETGYFRSAESEVMNLNYPFLYVNNGENLVVYDVSDNFKIVNRHGTSVINTALVATDNDVYYIYQKQIVGSNRTKSDIHSIFNEGALICSMEFDEWNYNTQIQFKDDYLYVSRTNAYTSVNYFDIYKVNGKETTLVDSIELLESRSCYGFILTDTHIFFKNYLPQSVSVLEFKDNKLSLAGLFMGSIDISTSKEHLLNYHNRNVLIRDINNFENILFTKQVTYDRNYEITTFDNEYFMLSDQLNNSDNPHSRIYRYNMNTNSLSYFYTFYNLRTNVSNGIIIKNGFENDITEYYTIINNKMVKIGEQETIPMVFHTLFFLEQKKMIQRSRGGIWVWDIDYKISESDQVIATDKRTVNVYPNPVRKTDVYFSLTTEPKARDQINRNEIVISIYNIKGQLVKKSKSFSEKSGEKSFTWDRKDDKGQPVANGVYLYKVNDGKEIHTGKFLIIK